MGTVRAVYFPRDDKTWEPMAYFFVQFETKQEAWMVADKLHGRRVDHGTRTLDVEWSTVEIDMNYIGRNIPLPGVARGCWYGDSENVTPDRRMMERPWITEQMVDHTGQIGEGHDGVRMVFCRDVTRWVYDQYGRS